MILHIAVSVHADVKTGASFLKIEPGAKPAGMGGAYTAISGDINALYYNPAGISSIQSNELAAMHTEWITDIKYDFAAGVFNLKNGVIGFSATLLTMGEIEGRDENRQTTGGFTAYDFSFNMSYARELNSAYSLGAGLKYIRQSIDDETADGIAVDIGAQRKLGNIFSLGAAVKNIGPQMKFIDEGYSLPLTAGFGAGVSLGGITLACDMDYEIVDKNLKLSFGTQYMPLQFLSLRGGYFINALKGLSDQSNDIFDLRNGLGGGLGINLLGYSLDYAVVPYVDFGNTQRISLSAKF